ncbi:MAG: archaellin/type IV pilin N-terminal domain-containing protein [Candidatus Hermodarchaeota archaeon]
MFRTLRKLYYKKKGISPVISAILLIGLAVAAGAILIIVVLPLLTPAANVTVQETVVSDRNTDGEIDKILIKLTNSGTAADKITEVSITGAGNWITEAVGTAVAPSTTSLTEVTYEAGGVGDQLEAGEDWQVTITLESGKVLTVDHDDESTIGTPATLTESSMLIDFTSGSGKIIKSTSSGDASYEQGASAGADATYSNNPGFSMRTDTSTNDVYFGYVAAAAPGDGSNYDTMNTYGNQLSSAIWDKQTKPFVEFWIKSDRVMGAGSIRVYFTAYSGSSEIDSSGFYYDIGATYLSSGVGYTANTWVRVQLDLSSSSGWSGYSTGEVNANNCGGFAIFFDNDEVANWDIYIDDIGVFSGF